jgi:hypothetical protein
MDDKGTGSVVPGELCKPNLESSQVWAEQVGYVIWADISQLHNEICTHTQNAETAIRSSRFHRTQSSETPQSSLEFA